MRISDIVNGPWAITPDMLGEIRSIYAKHMRGEKIDIRAVEAATGKQLKNRAQGYEVINGTAVIPIHGVIAKRMNMFMDISGGTSTQLAERDLRDALNDSSVNRIILHIDSPGGTVDGTFELAEFIYESRGKKPIIAYTDGMMTSAAYAIGSAAEKIFISGNTVVVGNIGVVTAHEDVSKLEEKMGVKTTEIYSGKFKRIATEYAPLSEEGRQSIQDRIDYLYSAFVSTVAKHRGVTPDVVLSRMSTDIKDMHIGLQAVEAGLVDGVSTLNRLINDKVDGVSARWNANKKEEGNMDLATLKEKHPDVYQAAFEEGKASMNAGIDQAKKDGAAAETARIKAIKEQAIPGHEALIETLMYDGVTTGEQAAVKILAAEKSIRGDMKNKLQQDAKDVPHVPAVEGKDNPPEKPADFMALVTAYAEEHKCSRGKAIEAVAKTHPAEHQAYLDKFNKK